MSLDIAIGDRIRYDFQYFIDHGIRPSYGFRSRYNSFKSEFLFDSNLINIKYNDFTNSLYLKTTFDKKFALGIGVEHKMLHASSENILTNGVETFFDNSNYLNIYSFLKLDTYDKKMFPTKGFYADLDFKWFVWSDRNNKLSKLAQMSEPFQQFSQIKGTIGFASTFYKKLTLQYTGEAGYTLGKKLSEMFDYRLGGYNQNYINNFTSFYGYDTGSLNDQSYLKSEINLRYQFLEKQYATFIANYARVEENVFTVGNLFDNIKSGYALGYGV